jgi:hypothetical protein
MDLIDVDNLSKRSRLKLSTLLPEYLQTRVNRNFFDATVETLFSETEAEVVTGYIGDKPERNFNSKTDFYITEINKDRQNYQLTPVINSGDKNVLYTDILNRLKHQGAIVNNQERLFRQDFYSFSPMIDLNMFVNFNQYFWLDKGPKTTEFFIEVEQFNNTNNTIEINQDIINDGDIVTLIGNLPQGIESQKEYTAKKVNTNTIQLLDNSVVVDFNFLNISDAKIYLRTEFNSVIGKRNVKIYDTTLVNGMVLRTYNDVLESFNGKRYVVEGVGDSIQLIEFDVLLGYDSSPYDTQGYDYDELSYQGEPNNIDYTTIQRGAINGNIWSMRNRWFHESLLNEQEAALAFRAKRPIIQFDKNISLYNFGEVYKGKVDAVYDLGNIQSDLGGSNLIIDGVDLDDNMTVLVINDIDIVKSNVIYKVFGKATSNVSLIPISTLNENDVVFVNTGDAYGGFDYYINNNTLIKAQTWTASNIAPLFKLYDGNKVELDDETNYENSNFNGSKLFSYKIDLNEPVDSVLGINLSFNDQGEVIFTNNLDDERYTFTLDFVDTEIKGNYYFKVNDQYRNHWHKNDIKVNQGIIDEFIVSDINKRIYALSQIPMESSEIQPINIIVRLNGILLTKNVDYTVTDINGIRSISTDKYIRLSDSLELADGDFLKITTYSDKTPNSDFGGYYEVPTLVGLTSNVNNENIFEISRNDVFDHFFSILERQEGFIGDPIGLNNSWNIKVNYGRGNKIVQNVSPIAKSALINNIKETEVTEAIKYAEREYRRFINKFDQKLIEVENNNSTNGSLQYKNLLDNIIDDINLGKTSDFPFFNSNVAGYDYIPTTPHYLGILPMYLPKVYLDTSFSNPTYILKRHDGSIKIASSQSYDYQEFQIDGSPSYQLQNFVNFAWEVMVSINGNYLDHTSDFIIVNSQVILNHSYSGILKVEYISDIKDKITLFFENSIFDNSPFNSVKPYKEVISYIPNFYRETDYTETEFKEILKSSFNKWVSQRGFDPVINDTFVSSDPNTFNYSGLLTDTGEILNGSWRSIFMTYYGTFTPHTSPWEILGFNLKPEWWDNEYGQFPYTSENINMWNDIQDGIIRHGYRQGQYEYLKKKNIRIPVDEVGNIKTIPEIFGTQQPTATNARKNWKFGDIGPVELEWRNSTHYAFAVIRALFLMNPNEFIELFWQPEDNKLIFDDQINDQLLSNETLKRIQVKNRNIHNVNGNFTYGIQQIIIAYAASFGKQAQFVADIIKNINIKLGYPTGGFIEKKSLTISSDNFGLVPQENININLHNSSPIQKIVASGIILTREGDTYIISGYDEDSRSIRFYKPVDTSESTTVNVGGAQPQIFDWQQNVSYSVGTYIKFDNKIYRCSVSHRSSDIFISDLENWAQSSSVPLIGGISVKKYSQYETNTSEVPYETRTSSMQEIFNIFVGYQKYLEDEGVIFNFTDNDSGNEINDFEKSAVDFLLWVASKPENGDTRIFSPFAKAFKFKPINGMVSPLNEFVNGNPTVVSGSGNTISVDDLVISRDDIITISVNPVTSQELMYKVELQVTEKEHLVSFDNRTNFNDIIFEDIINLRQPRLKVFMYRSKNWNGKMIANGFIVDNDTISSNIETSVDRFREYYDSEKFIIGENLSNISKNLFGYQGKPYFRNLLIDQRDSFNIYQGQLQEKGTNRSVKKLLRNDFVRSISNIDINELWAIRTGRYGNLNAYENIDFKVRISDIRSNPQVIQFLDEGEDDPRNNIIELSPDDDRFTIIRNSFIGSQQFKTGKVENKLPGAGFLLLSEAKFKLSRYENINTEFLPSDIHDYDRLWVAENGNYDWEVIRFTDSGITLDSIDDGQLIVSSTTGLAVDDVVIFNNDDLRTLFVITGIIDSTTIEAKTINGEELPNAEIETPVNIFNTELVTFDNISDFQSYTPKKPWNNDDLVFIKDTKTVINPFTNEVIRVLDNQVKVDNISSSRLYENIRKTTVAELNVYHPVQGFIPLDAKKNIDFIISLDPAKYNSEESLTKKQVWGKEQVGKIWWNVDKVRYLDYDQSSMLYKTNNWGGIFPNTDIEICQWVRSPFPPNRWEDYLNTQEGSSTFGLDSEPLDITRFVTSKEYNPRRGQFMNYYYFWVKNDSNTKGNKTLSTSEIRDIIKSPTKQGIRWISPIDNDIVIISNIQDIVSDDTVVQINYSSDKLSTQHSEWFLFGDKTDNKEAPQYIFDKVKHSIVGYVEIIDTLQNHKINGYSDDLIEKYGTEVNGLIDLKLPVPDTSIISKPLYGSLFRPRQSWYRDILMARQAFIVTVNKLLKERNWVDSDSGWQDVMFIEENQPSSDNYDIVVDTLFDRDELIGTIQLVAGIKVLVENDISIRGKWSLWEFDGNGFTLISRQGFRLSDYWKFVDYFVDGYDENTIPSVIYDNISDRNNDIANRNVGDIVKTLDDGTEKFIFNEVILSNDQKSFRLIGKQDATFEFDLFICVCPFGDQAIQNLFEGFYETLSTSNSRNRLLIEMINEAYRQNPVVDWAFKTSLVDLVGLEEELVQSSIQIKNLEENIVDFFNDTKPFHVTPLSTTEIKRSISDTANLIVEDDDEKEITIVIDRVSCNADMSLPENKWTAAERIFSYGGIPEDEIEGCKFRGTEIDSKFFNFFSNVIGAGYDVNSYDSTILGYDFNFDDIQTLYDVMVNGGEFTDPSDPNTVIDGGSFYQPLLSTNRPPEKVNMMVGDFMMFDVFTSPVNIDFSFGYDAQAYDAEVDLEGNLSGYDFTPLDSSDFVFRPKIVQDFIIGDGLNDEIVLSQIPQSNDAIFVYIDGILIDGYQVIWDKRRPKILLDNVPNFGSYVKVVSYSIGGNSSVINDKLFTNVDSTSFDMDVVIEPSFTIISVVNGNEVPNQLGSSNSEVIVPSANIGDSVYIIVYQGEGFTRVTNEKFTYDNHPIETKISSPKSIQEIESVIYKNGKRLAPSYSRYFDPIEPVESVYFDERTYSDFGLKVFIDGSESSAFTYDKITKMVTFAAPQNNVEIFVLNDVNAEFHYEDDNLFIHTVAYADNVVTTIPSGSRMFINNNFIQFNRPNNQPIPLDDGVPNVISGIYNQNQALISINGIELNVFTTDTISDFVNKVNTISDQTLVKATQQNNDVFLVSNGTDIILDGQWSNIGFTSGAYKNVVSIMQEFANGEFRVSSLDGRIKVISRSGDPMTFTSTGAFDLVSAFGFQQMYDNQGSIINVISQDNNDSNDKRTEVYRGSVTGQYPVTKSGLNDYSVKVSVIGHDMINKSDFEFKSIDLGYDTNGYGKEYDYNEKLGIDFVIPHNEVETIIVTSYSAPERDSKTSFRIVKTLSNTVECYNITEDNESILSDDVYPTDKELKVKSIEYLPRPKPETNTPAFISIEGEIIGYYEIDESDPSNPILKNIIRGAKGSVFGYTNGEDNDGAKVIKSGTKVINMSDVLIPAKEPSQLTFV